MHAQILFSFSTLDAPGAFHDLELARRTFFAFLETLESQKGLMKTLFWYKDSPKLGSCRRAHLTCVWRCVGRWEGVFRLNDVICLEGPVAEIPFPILNILLIFLWGELKQIHFKHFLDVFFTIFPTQIYRHQGPKTSSRAVAVVEPIVERLSSSTCTEKKSADDGERLPRRFGEWRWYIESLSYKLVFDIRWFLHTFAHIFLKWRSKVGVAIGRIETLKSSHIMFDPRSIWLMDTMRLV